jgi:medium-chain acyl-[acyl-carrier-protein] hydrolase
VPSPTATSAIFVDLQASFTWGERCGHVVLAKRSSCLAKEATQPSPITQRRYIPYPVDLESCIAFSTFVTGDEHWLPRENRLGAEPPEPEGKTMSIPSLKASAALSSTPWLPSFSAQPEDKLRLYCFPHAGGAASAFAAWGRALSPDVQVCAVEYPGRWSRHREPPFLQIPKLVETVLRDMRSHWQGRFAFFGYSFGALIAFELARALRREQLPSPERLVVGARGAPQLPNLRDPIRSLPDQQFIAAVGKRYGALPPVVLQDPEMLQLILPSLRADITAFETYEYQTDLPLSCPVVAMTGKEDSMIEDSDVKAWSEQTQGSFAQHTLPGGHFFIQSHQDQVIALVKSSLLNGGNSTP